MENSFLIKTKDLVKTYPMGQTKIFALNGVNLNFMPGEFAGLVGPSGSGKTTFLNIVGSLSRQSEYFLFRAKQKFPVLSWSKSSLDTSYDEAKDHVFSTDGQLVGCILIFS